MLCIKTDINQNQMFLPEHEVYRTNVKFRGTDKMVSFYLEG